MSYARKLATIARTGVAKVATAQALRDANRALYPDAITTEGAIDSTDGGGGMWVWDPTSVDDDNLVSVLKPTGHVGPGRWVREITERTWNIRWAGGVADGVTNDRDAIQACLEDIHAKGGGTLLIPDNIFTNGGHWVYSNTRIKGEVPFAKILLDRVNAPYGGNLFFNLDGFTVNKMPTAAPNYEPTAGGVVNGWLNYISYAATTDLSAGDTSITFTTAVPFQKDDVIAVYSTAGYDDGTNTFYPYFVDIVRVLAVSGNTVTLYGDTPITVGIVDPKATVGDQFTGENSLPENITFESLTVDCITCMFRCRALLNGVFRDLIIKSDNAAIIANGVQRSVFENITSHLGATGQFGRHIELKTGSAHCQFYNLTCYAHPEFKGYVLETGEMARNFDADGVRFFKPVSTPGHVMSSLYRDGRTTGNISFRNFTVVVDEVIEIIGIDPIGIEKKNIVIDNFSVEANSVDYGIRFFGAAAGEQQVKNLTIRGVTCTAAPAVGGYLLYGPHENVTIENNSIRGTIGVSPSVNPAGGWVFRNNTHTGPQAGFTSFNLLTYPQCRNVTVDGPRTLKAATIGNAVTDMQWVTFAVPSGTTLQNGDHFIASGSFWLRTNAADFQLQLRYAGGTVETTAVPAGQDGVANAKIAIGYLNANQWRVGMSLSLPDGSVRTAQVLVNQDLKLGQDFEIWSLQTGGVAELDYMNVNLVIALEN